MGMEGFTEKLGEKMRLWCSGSIRRFQRLGLSSNLSSRSTLKKGHMLTRQQIDSLTGHDNLFLEQEMTMNGYRDVPYKAYHIGDRTVRFDSVETTDIELGFRNYSNIDEMTYRILVPSNLLRLQREEIKREPATIGNFKKLMQKETTNGKS